MPRDDNIVLPAHTEDPVASRYHQRKNSCVLLVKFKVGGAPKSCSVAKIDDLQSSQICRTASFHQLIPLFQSVYTLLYAKRRVYLAVRPKKAHKK